MAGNVFDYEAKRKALLAKGHLFTNVRSDGEFILHAIEEWGDKAIEGLNGTFALALYDLETGTLTVSNDRYGMKPIFYHYSRPNFAFGSTVGAVLEDGSVRREINWEAWRDFFSFGFVLGTKTFFKNIQRLPAASILTVRDEGVMLKNYWSYTGIHVDHSKSEEYFVKMGARLVKRAIERWCWDLEECIVLLSGGYDSRCIAGGIRYHTKSTLETLTSRNLGDIPWSYSPQSYVDAVLAAKVANCLGVKNTYVPIPSNLWQQYFISKTLLVDAMCHEHLWILPLVDRLVGDKVAFDGLAIDLLLGGVCLTPDNLKPIADRRELAHLLRREERKFHGWEIAPEIISDLFFSPISEKLRPSIDSVLEEVSRIGDHENVVTIYYMENRTRNAASVLANNIIAKNAPCFVPFLDNDLVEFSLTIPPTMKVKGEIYFKIMKTLFPELMRVPSSPHSQILTYLRSHVKDCRPSYLISLFAEMAKHSFVSRISHSRRALHRETVEYLIDLVCSMPAPSFVNMEKVKETTRACLSHNKDPSSFLVAIAEFCVWYNMTYLKESGAVDNRSVCAKNFERVLEAER
jgi:asparagine synthase (glutamine-hydrolysing)